MDQASTPRVRPGAGVRGRLRRGPRGGDAEESRLGDCHVQRRGQVLGAVCGTVPLARAPAQLALDGEDYAFHFLAGMRSRRWRSSVTARARSAAQST